MPLKNLKVRILKNIFVLLKEKNKWIVQMIKCKEILFGHTKLGPKWKYFKRQDWTVVKRFEVKENM